MNEEPKTEATQTHGGARARLNPCDAANGHIHHAYLHGKCRYCGKERDRKSHSEVGLFERRLTIEESMVILKKAVELAHKNGLFAKTRKVIRET